MSNSFIRYNLIKHKLILPIQSRRYYCGSGRVPLATILYWKLVHGAPRGFIIFFVQCPVERRDGKGDTKNGYVININFALVD